MNSTNSKPDFLSTTAGVLAGAVAANLLWVSSFRWAAARS